MVRTITHFIINTMTFRYVFLAVFVFRGFVVSALPGACVIQCDIDGRFLGLGLTGCPPNHECRSTGCGTLCFSTHQNITNTRGSCIMLCGESINKACGLNGYDCLSNGCGRECKLNAAYVQPDHCPSFQCDLHCPTGYLRDEQGCDHCQCAWTIVDTSHNV